MARDFSSTSTYLTIGNNSALVPSFPMTCGAWINNDTATGTDTIFSFGRGGTSGWKFGMSGDEVQFTKYGVVDITSTALNVSTSTSLFIGAVVTSTNVHLFKITTSGVITTEDVANSSAFDNTPTPTEGRIGVALDSGGSPTSAFDGRIAEVFAYIGGALIDSDLVALSRLCPIQRNFLKGYWPIYGVQSPEPDLSGYNYHGTVTGASTADHPPGISAIWLAPNPQRVQRVFAAGGGGIIYPQLERGVRGLERGLYGG